MVEFVDFGLGADAAGDDKLFGRAGAQDGGGFDGETLHCSFGVDVGVEEGGAVVFEPGDGLFGGEVDVFFPTFDGDFAVFGVDGEDEVLFAEGGVEGLREGEIEDGVTLAIGLVVAAEEGGAVDDSGCAEVEHALTVLRGAEAAAHLAGEVAGELLDEGGVGALAHGGVEIDELDEGILLEAVDPVVEVVEGELEGFALDELDDAAVHEVDGGYEHISTIVSGWQISIAIAFDLARHRHLSAAEHLQDASCIG